MILLTGANGFLGKIILQNSNEKIYTLGRFGDLDISVDLSKNIPILPKVDIVIHSAGKAHSIPKTDSEKKGFHDVNVLGTSNLLKGLEKSGLPKQFVFISSVSVYGQESGNNICEEHALLAKDPYGLSKIEAEQLVKNWCDKNQVTCSILRLPLLVGKKPPGNLGAMIKAINKGYYFNIGGGTAKKSMVLAKDVACFILTVAPIGGIYNLTDGLHPSFSELSLAISKNKIKQFNLPIYAAKIMGLVGDFLGDRVPINSFKIKKITSDLTFDDSKARKLLNWKPQSILEFLKKEDLD
ncbi:NAD-dependent epimerase/dehydratase family protein [Flavobacterium sp. ALJ2]|uniref:NAD-dependent epimerase/dehydratase family protein n=1 Tax=Flavobacterium sp. ALJ2 TaxID=2786960 RepID=UPI00189FD294|nr:NAD-dependent epimerase/dehydratase family protein [Flavobacterium sp. ALJ2]MBF7090638.1 NAD-dependent epimerase/dehydratase family protein [Flavobacterium sp. ALJ2]